MLPFIDSANHDGKNANCELDLISIQDNFVMRAREDISKGQEIRISYGKKHNDNLFQFFGFIESSNPYDRYYIQNYKEKWQFFQNNDKNLFMKTFMAKQPENQQWREKAILLTKSASSMDNLAKSHNHDKEDLKRMKEFLQWEMDLLQGQFQQFLERYFTGDLSEDQRILRCWIEKYLQSKLDVLKYHLS